MGDIQLRTYGPIVVLGIGMGWWLCRRYAYAVGISPDDVDAIAFWAILGGILGTRILHVIDKWDEIYSKDMMLIPQMWKGGGAIWGGIIGGVSGGVLGCIANGLPIRPLMDVGGLGLILGQAIGRLANIINGEHTRVASDLPWAFLYTDSSTLAERDSNGITYPAHPAAAYEAVADLIFLAVLINLIHRWGGSGRVFFVYIFLYSWFRFAVTFLRRDELYGLFTQAQWIALVLGVVATIVLIMFQLGNINTRTDHWKRARQQSGYK